MKVVSLGNEEFEGQNNAYLLPAGDAVALVDTGISSPTVRDAIADELATLGFEIDDVETILLTHWHQDHSGIAGELQAESEATVYTHEADAPIVRQDEAVLEALGDRQRDRFEDWGIPADKCEELLAALSTDYMRGRPPTVEPLVDGDTVALGDWTLTTVHAPGHTAGLCCFAFDGQNGSEWTIQ